MHTYGKSLQSFDFITNSVCLISSFSVIFLYYCIVNEVVFTKFLNHGDITRNLKNA